MKDHKVKRYKIVNSKTGNAISYCTVGADLEAEKVKEELDNAMKQVAVKNGVFIETLYWEEDKES